MVNPLRKKQKVSNGRNYTAPASSLQQRLFKGRSSCQSPADKQSTKRFLSPQCIQSLTKIKQSGEMQAKSTAEFLEKMSETSYIGQKMLKREPTPPQSPTRCRPVMNTSSPSHRERRRLGFLPVARQVKERYVNSWLMR